MLDVPIGRLRAWRHLPTTAGREIILTRHTHPEKDLQLLLDQLHLTLPEQPPPWITTAPQT